MMIILETVLLILVCLYLCCLVKGGIWVFQAIMIIGSVIVKTGIKIQTHHKNSAIMLTLRMMFVVPVLGLCSFILPRNLFGQVTQATIDEIMKILVDPSEERAIFSQFKTTVQNQISR